MNNLKLIKIIKLKRGSKRKYQAVFQNKNKIIKRLFGLVNATDYTTHKNVKRRNRYIKKHKKKLQSNNPTSSSYLSIYLLFQKKSLKSAIKDFKRRLVVYNKTGKFPKSISNSVLKNKYQFKEVKK